MTRRLSIFALSLVHLSFPFTLLLSSGWPAGRSDPGPDAEREHQRPHPGPDSGQGQARHQPGGFHRRVRQQHVQKVVNNENAPYLTGGEDLLSYYLILALQCSGSVGFLSFWAFWIRIRVLNLFVRIRGSFHQQAKKTKKPIDLYCLVTYLWLFIFEEWCKCTFKKE